MYCIEATLYFRKSPLQPKRIREVVEGDTEREQRSAELSRDGYSVFSWPIDDDDSEIRQ